MRNGSVESCKAIVLLGVQVPGDHAELLRGKGATTIGFIWDVEGPGNNAKLTFAGRGQGLNPQI